MKIALFPNHIKDKSFEYTKKVIDKLYSLNMEVLLEKKYSQWFESKNVFFCESISEMVDLCDIVLTVGGDGTVIHFAKYAAESFKPILGINLGRLGFITGMEKDELFKLDLLAEKNYKVQHRTMLKVTTLKGKGEEFFAFNDMVVSRDRLSKIIDFSVYLGENEVCSYRADGLIMSTSTGSTAYSLSAGGPVIDPTLDCMILTPICSHSMFAKPIIFSGNVPVSIKAKKGSEVFLSIDGNNVDMTNCSEVKIELADKKSNLIMFDNRSFYRRLSEKFSYELVNNLKN